MSRKYLPTLAELVDRLSIVQLKEVFITDHKDEYAKEIKEIVQKAAGYLTVIKIEEDMKATIDIFTVDPIKYKMSEKIKKSFDPKRILNPGKMYSGI